MKSTIKSKINRLLKFLGFNVVKAKRPRAKKPAYRSHVPIEDANTGCCERPRVEQPNSDNGVKGPTS